jgi:hypothetical protein
MITKMTLLIVGRAAVPSVGWGRQAIVDAVLARAQGFLVKDAPGTQIVHALCEVAAGAHRSTGVRRSCR